MRSLICFFERYFAPESRRACMRPIDVEIYARITQDDSGTFIYVLRVYIYIYIYVYAYVYIYIYIYIYIHVG